jgi:hypothetical protein
MGMSSAVTYAIVVLHVKEQATLKCLLCKHSEFEPPLFFKRYIDDFFFKFVKKWMAELFIEEFNRQNPSIQLPASSVQYGSPGSKVNFLDVCFKRSKDGRKVTVEPYIKPMNTFQYLHRQSGHKPHVFSSFIESELNRFMIRSSNFLIFASIREQFYTHLLDRGYDHIFIQSNFDKHFGRMSDIDANYIFAREALIKKRISSKLTLTTQKSLPPIFCTRVRLPRVNLKDILSTRGTGLEYSSDLAAVFHYKDPIVAESRYNYVSRHLTSSSYEYQIESPDAAAFQFMEFSKYFDSPDII